MSADGILKKRFSGIIAKDTPVRGLKPEPPDRRFSLLWYNGFRIGSNKTLKVATGTSTAQRLEGDL